MAFFSSASWLLSAYIFSVSFAGFFHPPHVYNLEDQRLISRISYLDTYTYHTSLVISYSLMFLNTVYMP